MPHGTRSVRLAAKIQVRGENRGLRWDYADWKVLCEGAAELDPKSQSRQPEWNLKLTSAMVGLNVCVFRLRRQSGTGVPNSHEVDDVTVHIWLEEPPPPPVLVRLFSDFLPLPDSLDLVIRAAVVYVITSGLQISREVFEFAFLHALDKVAYSLHGLRPRCRRCAYKARSALAAVPGVPGCRL